MIRRGDLLAWALACGATPEVAAEVEQEAWRVRSPSSDPYLRALVHVAADSLAPSQPAAFRAWSEMAAVTMLAAYGLRPRPALVTRVADAVGGDEVLDLGDGVRAPRSEVQAAVLAYNERQRAAREAERLEPCAHCGHARGEHCTDSGGGPTCHCGCRRGWERVR